MFGIVLKKDDQKRGSDLSSLRSAKRLAQTRGLASYQTHHL